MGIFVGNEFPLQTFMCSEEPYVQTQRADKLINDLSKMIGQNSLIYVDNDLKVWQNLVFDVKSSSGELTAVIDRNGVKVTANNEIKETKRFFRIGIVHAMPYTYYKRDSKTKKILRDGNNQPIYEGYCIDVRIYFLFFTILRVVFNNYFV